LRAPCRPDRLTRRVTAALVAAALIAGPPAMTLRHAYGGMMMPAPVAMGHHHGGSSRPGGPARSPLSPCCDLCVVGCVSALHLARVTLPLPVLGARLPSPAIPVVRPAVGPRPLRLPPAVGPPALI
jgi:hypothetical protein